MQKTKIIIAGIGGVGGYFGALLARHFENNNQVEINFIARGKHLEEIKKNGLLALKGTDKIIARPTHATDNPAEIGLVDYIIICTKTYDLETIIQQLKPCISNDTCIIPLLNGVNNKEVIKRSVPNGLVVDGCAYIIARLTAPGVIENIGNIQQLHFGIDNDENEKLRLLERLLKEAGIEAFYSTCISKVIWEKFIFLSATATTTSFLDKNIDEIVSNTDYCNTLIKMIEEVKQLAQAKQIAISTNITQEILTRMKSIPANTTTSMHTDFQHHKPHTELQSLTGFVINEASKYSIPTPTYEMMYEKLKKRT
ncbi:MAG: 2-dehydropantoate 2-reductase [Bacteroidia bacterium]